MDELRSRRLTGRGGSAVDRDLEVALFAARSADVERLEAEGGPLGSAMGSWVRADILNPRWKATYREIASQYGLTTDLDRSAADERHERFLDNLRRTRESLAARRVSPLAAAQLIEQVVAHYKPHEIAPPEGFQLMLRLRDDGQTEDLRASIASMLAGL